MTENSTPEDPDITARGKKQKKPWWQRKRIIIPALAVIAFLFIPTDGDDKEETAAPSNAPTATTPSVEATPTSDASTPAPAPTTSDLTPAPRPPAAEPEPELEPEWDAAAAEEALLDDIYASNGMRTIEESCTTDMLIEGTWWQCYYDDLQFVSESTLKVILTTPGDVDERAIHEATRTWFVNMVDPSSNDAYSGLSSVYTSVNGLDSAQQGRWR